MLLVFRTAAFRVCMVLLLVFLSGCGGEEGTASTPDASGGVKAEAPQFRTIEHKFGKTEIPVNSQRIVSVFLEDMLLTLDLPLMLAVTVGANNYLEPLMKTRNIQGIDSLSLEAVLHASPDLIIASDIITQDEYDALTKIAPTVVYNRRTWKSSLPQIAKDLGKEEKAASMLKTHEVQLKEAKNKLAPVLEAKSTVALVRVTAKDLRLYFPSILAEKQVQGYATALYQDIGLQADPLALELQKKNPERENATISMELLPQLKANYILVTVGSASGTAEDVKKDLDSFAEIEKSPVWQSLPAYKQGHIYTVGAKHWISDGMLADEMKINDVVQAFGK